MNVSEFCIRRPVATLLMSMALIVGGLFAFGLLPVAALPRTDFPTINVSASLPGASPDTMAKSVATPLIKQFATIEGIKHDQRQQHAGQHLDRHRVRPRPRHRRRRGRRAIGDLAHPAPAARRHGGPAELSQGQSGRPADPAAGAAQRRDGAVAARRLRPAGDVAAPVDPRRRRPGQRVRQPEIRRAHPGRSRMPLASRDIGIDEIAGLPSALANTITPVGVIRNSAQTLTIEAETQLNNAAQFADLIIATRDGKPVRLRDVAKVIDSVENNQTASWYDGSRSIVLAIQRQPDANTVEVVDRVKAMLPQFRDELPPTVSIDLLNDRSDLDPRCGARRRNDADADRRAGDPGHFPVPAATERDAHRDHGGADLADRHRRRHVSAQLLDRQHLAACPHPGGRPGGGRCHRHAGEHRPPHRRRHAAVRGRPQGQPARSASPSSPSRSRWSRSSFPCC